MNQMSKELQARGPVCECSDPRCFEPLGITWEELAERGTELQLSPTCFNRPNQAAEPEVQS